jgi:hypothetical protein
VSPEIQAALAQSHLGRGLMAARGTFLSGLSTYLLKLGPENLPADFHPIDRRIAAAFPSLTARLRLQDMATLLRDGLEEPLAAARDRPLHLINIAGGPAADSWNSLIALRAAGAPLAHRVIAVTVLDLDDKGPAFGARAFEALQADRAPLHGVRVRFQHAAYNWAATAELPHILGGLDLTQSLCAIASEGGLFEYGSDQEIAANLAALRDLTSRDAIVVGSAARDCDLTSAHAGIGVTLRPRTREAFQRLVEGSGWTVQALIERPFSDNVRLAKM